MILYTVNESEYIHSDADYLLLRHLHDTPDPPSQNTRYNRYISLFIAYLITEHNRHSPTQKQIRYRVGNHDFVLHYHDIRLCH